MTPYVALGVYDQPPPTEMTEVGYKRIGSSGVARALSYMTSFGNQMARLSRYLP